MKRLLFPFTIMIVLLTACSKAAAPTQATEPPTAAEAPQTEAATSQATEAPTKAPVTEVPMPFELTSPVFSAGEAIPERYSCDGLNISPDLFWGNAPDSTQSLALIMDDPDAPGGTWVHWVMFNIPPDITGLDENIHQGTEFSGLAPTIGRNSWNQPAYGGPCPPSGEHRYFFKLYALDTVLDLAADADKAELESAMEGHILAETELMGVFSK